MYTYYQKIANKVIPTLTNEQIEAIYRYKQMEYRMEDVKNHAENMYNDGELTYSEMIYVCKSTDILAERFIYKYEDCSLPENDVFIEMIRNYVSDNRDNIPFIEEEE